MKRGKSGMLNSSAESVVQKRHITANEAELKLKGHSVCSLSFDSTYLPIYYALLNGSVARSCIVDNHFCYQKDSKETAGVQKVGQRDKERWEEQSKSCISIQHVDPHLHTHSKED